MSGKILFVFLGCLFCFDLIAAIDYPWQPLLKISNNTLAKAILPRYLNLNLINDYHLSSKCRMDIHRAINALYERKTWSYKLFDSWARSIPSGMMVGTFADLGDFDQCISINPSHIISKYCIMDLSIAMPKPVPLHLKTHVQVLNDNETKLNGTIFNHMADKSSLFYYVHLWMGICLPESCSQKDIQYSFNTTGITQYGFRLHSSSCNNGGKKWKLNILQIISLIVFGSLLSMNVISAIYENFIQNENDSSLIKTIMKWFSPIQNTNKIISTKSLKQGELSCLHGIRFISMVWIIIGHVMVLSPRNLHRRSFEIPFKITGLQFQPLLNGFYSTQTFFYLSGLLTSIVTFKHTKGDYRKFQYIPFILMRYLRLTPQLIMYMLLDSFTSVLSNGPSWSLYSKRITYQCSKTWWYNLFYIQNWFNLFDICSGHTWFLAADMQLHIISGIFILLLLRNYRIGMMATKFFIIVFIFVSAAIVYIKKFPPGLMLSYSGYFVLPNEKSGELLLFFLKPWIHIIIFFTGIITGVHLPKWSPKTIKTNVKFFYWSLVVFGYLFCIYYTAPWLNGRLPINPLLSAILLPLSRIIWALVLTLIVWLCVTNNGIFIGRFLSWSLFRPLSRITYSVYLTHPAILFICLHSRRNLMSDREIDDLSLMVSMIIFSYIVGFIFTIICECPFTNIIDYIRNHRSDMKNTKFNNNKSKCPDDQRMESKV
uniref:Nose resistant to fluoxetine protein 6-like n=1 Tax=Dermatophagoides pteronyssinus TaxID=6956 RepID=A0A6P6XXX8_DERPT|nr:nose resistant to fluoxetine protein 6-like [Dermatophagoides pteronyssinus]